MSLLEVRGVHKRFGGLAALKDVNLTCSAGELTALIGPNGAGKTTLVNVMSGLTKPDAGNVVFNGRDITGWTSNRIANLGLSRTYQRVRLFPKMTVLENVIVACHRHYEIGLFKGLFQPPGVAAAERNQMQDARDALELVGLADRADENPMELPYGRQRVLEIARSLATRPQLLLLDEPAAGLNSFEKEELGALLQRILGMGISVLIIDHDMTLIMGVSHRVIVLSAGTVIASGEPEEIQQNPQVIESYLGTAGLELSAAAADGGGTETNV